MDKTAKINIKKIKKRRITMNNYIIKLEPFEFCTLEKICINKEINNHFTAEIRGIIEDELEEKYLKMLIYHVWCRMIVVDENKVEKVLFCGIVTDFSIEYNRNDKVFSLEIKSGTYLMDIYTHLRSFQNDEISYCKILDILKENYLKYEYMYLFNLENDKVHDFLLQYQETDWEFIKRVASLTHQCIVPEDRQCGIKYSLGFAKGKECFLDIKNNFRIKKELINYSKNPDFIDADFLIYIFIDREIYQIGDYMTINSTTVYIYKIESNYSNGELLHTYYLRSKKGIQTEVQYNNIQGISLEATVTEIKETKVKIRIKEDENINQTILKWFPFSTVYSSADGTGWYFMPEINDEVRFYLPNNREADGYVISAIHLETHNSARKNPNNKSIKNKYGKEILFTPDSLILTNNNGIKIELSDNNGINIESDKSITINATQDLTVSSSEASLVISGTDSVFLNQNGTSIKLEEGLDFKGGEFKIQ